MEIARLKLIASQAIGQLAIVLAMPFLTRIFAPDQLGWYQLAFTIAIVIQPLVTLRAEFTIPSEAQEDQVSHSVTLAYISCVLISIVVGILSIVFFVIDRNDWGLTAAMTAIIAVSYAGSLLENAIMVRDANMAKLALRNLLTGLLTGGLQVVLAFLFRDVIWLAIAVMLGRFIAVGLTGVKTFSHLSFASIQLQKSIPTRTITGIFSGFVSSLNTNGTLLLVQPTLGAAAAGFVGVAMRASQAPLGLVSQALSQSVQATIGGAVRSGDQDLLRQVNQQLRFMLPYAILATLGLTIGGPIMAEPLFGSGWGISGEIIAVMGVPAGMQLLVGPIMPIYYMIAAESHLLKIQVIRIFLSFLGGFLGYLVSGDLIQVVAGYAIGTTIGYVISYLDLKQLLTADAENATVV